MNRKVKLIIITNIFITNLIAQNNLVFTRNLNLVLNPSFEEFQDKIPCNFYYNYKEFNYAVKDWKTPNRGKPIVYNILECQPDFFYSSVEDSLLPHSGNSMISIQTFKNEPRNYQEYIQGTLKEPLEKGKSYYIEFYISRNFNAKYASNNLGFCFIDNPSFKNDRGPIELSPDFNLKEIIYTKKGEWIKISKIVRAQSNSKYFIIGNFHEYRKTKHIIASEPRAAGNSAVGTASYFIDDVSVIPVDEHFKGNEIESISLGFKEQDDGCYEAENLIRNSQFNDYEVYKDENHELIYSPLYWHYKTTRKYHPIYFSTERFLDKSSIRNNAHPDSKRILQGDTLNYIGVPILPKSEPVYSKLKCKLEKDCHYDLSVKIRLFGYSNCFSDLLVDFSSHHPFYYDSISHTLQLPAAGTINADYMRNNWVNLSAQFQAHGDEEYLLIGVPHEIEYKRIISENLQRFDIRNEYVREFNMNFLIDDVILKKVFCFDQEKAFSKLDSLNIGDSFILENLHFEFNKYNIKEESLPYLDKLFNYLSNNSELNVLITGHTDNVGTESYNKDLSTNRAKAVYDYMVNKGIDDCRLEYYGAGFTQPLSSGSSEKDKQRNRRVEIKLIE